MKYTFASSLNTVKQYNHVINTTVFIVALFLLGCSNGEKMTVSAPPTQILPVLSINKSSETTFLEYPATIEGAVDLEIRPQIYGNLDQVYVNEGQLVKKGQPLFKVNDLPYKEALNTAQASLQSARAAAANAQLEIEKLTPLVDHKVVSDFQLKSAKAAYQMALATIEQAKAGVATAKINLGYTLITAPVTGYVGRLPKKQGSLVSATDPEPLTQLSDAHEVHAYFSLSEDDFISFNERYSGKTIAQRIKNIPSVSLVLANHSIYPLQGKLDMVDGQFDKQTGAITLRATFPNQAGTLRSGNTGKLRLALKHQNALSVPQESTMEIQDKIFVFTVDRSNKVSRQPITVVGTSSSNYLVNGGLKAGDRIVYKGIGNLKDGDSIEIAKSENLTAINNSNNK